MEDLRANTDIMRSGARQLDEVGGQLAQAADTLSRLPDRVSRSAYEGQLASQVQRILAGVSGQARQVSNEVRSTGDELNNKASAIDVVIQYGAERGLALDSALGKAPPGSANAGLFRMLAQLNLNQVGIYFGLAGVAGLVYWYLTQGQKTAWVPPNEVPLKEPPVSKRNYISTNSQLYLEADLKKRSSATVRSGQSIDILETKTDTTGTTWQRVRFGQSEGWVLATAVISTVMLSQSPIRGESVRPGLDEEETTLYYRYVNNVPSDCTWYAAAAVDARSGGKIDLDNRQEGGQGWSSWGNGGSWASSADTVVQGYDAANVPMQDRKVFAPDRTPKAGDVYSNETFHVAYVEETWLSEDKKKIFVVVSEENGGSLRDGVYIGTGGRVGQPSEPISLPDAPRVMRYRRTMVFDNVAGETEHPSIPNNQGRFIHFNYD